MFNFKNVNHEEKHIQSCTDCRHFKEFDSGKSAEESSGAWRESSKLYKWRSVTVAWRPLNLNASKS
jgi:hypothetical protein